MKRRIGNGGFGRHSLIDFGGKATIASDVWDALGQPAHYLEPFLGSGAVLLARPNYDPTKHTETICDVDGFISNVWRALSADPDAVAKVCDYPVNHADLSARKLSLLANEKRLLENLATDPKWYDAEMAGYWIWAASCWIGSGLTAIGQRPHLSGGYSSGMGIHSIGKIPRLADTGTGVHKIGGIPHLSDRGTGVHKIGKRPDLSGGFSSGKGIHSIGKRPPAKTEENDLRDPYNTNLYKWFRILAERLRYVRVVCGDWTRVCGGNWQDDFGDCGIFFDPPYGVEDRHQEVYHRDDLSVAREVADWCIERGKKQSYRIVLAGYYEEHERLLSFGWTVKRWQAQGGYSTQGKGKTQGKANRFREALFFSPNCKRAELF